MDTIDKLQPKSTIALSDSAAVDYLKFAGIILILIEHFIIFFIQPDPVLDLPIWFIGVAGVGLFTFSSGFLAKATSNDNFKPGKYLLKRFFRLYPLYLLALILTFGNAPNLAFNYKIFSLFLLQSLDNGGTAWFALWFVPFIMLCYVLFSLFMVNKRAFKVAAAIFLGSYIFAFWQFATTINMVIYALELPAMLAVFFLGVRTVHVPLKITKPPALVIKNLSRLAYPIYLFQYPFFVAINQNGFVLSLVCLSTVFVLYYLSTKENLIGKKRFDYTINRDNHNNQNL